MTTDAAVASARPRSAAGDVEILPPREVPLGGPRAMSVYRCLPQKARWLIGAWCFLDSYGPDAVARTGGMRVPRHPHTGLATVSWLFEGCVEHIDSAGHQVLVRPGELNLMTAGWGITHSEFSTVETTDLHGVQLWFALPDAHRFTAPRLDSFRPEPVEGEGWSAKVFLGSLLGRTSPVPTPLPLTGAEIRLSPGASLRVELPPEHEHGVVGISGEPTADGVAVPRHGIDYLPTGRREVLLQAGEEPAVLVLIGGEPLNEQIVMWWNFIGRSHEEVAAWRRRYMEEMGFEDGGSAAGSGAAEDGGTTTPGPADAEARPDPQFGRFPPGQPAPLPAPALPNIRLRARG